MDVLKTCEARQGSRLGPGERIRRGSEYRQVYEKGTSVHGRALVVFTLRSDDLVLRAGFVAGRRVGGAVQRNRARRVMREAYRRLKSLLPGRGIQLVFVARGPCARQSLAQIDREMRELLGRSGILT